MRALIVVVLIAVSTVAIYLAGHTATQPRADAAPVMNAVADVQRAMARAPASVTRPSDSEEIAIGRSLEARYRSDDRGPLAPYVREVGQRVADRAHRRVPYSFHTIDDARMVNAFALPGGPVFIGTGLIALMRTEDELAMVLAHEIEHIDHYHCIDRFESQRVALRLPVVGAVAQIPLALYESGYAKVQELEADAEGARLAFEAGYAPLAVEGLFTRMEGLRAANEPGRASSPVGELLQVPASAIQAYFRSHPPTAERVARINDVVRDDRQPRGAPTRPLKVTVDKE